MPETIGKELTWVDINDFTPGIISQSNYAYSNTTSPVPAKQAGAAQIEGTFGCIALPNGGLGPLPGIAKTVPSGVTPVTGSAECFVNGALVYGPIGGSDELLFGVESLSSTQRQFQLVSYIDVSSTTTEVIAFTGTRDATTGIVPLTGGLTMVNPTTPTDPGQPCVALSYTFVQNSGSTASNWLYPNPSDTGSFTLYDFDPAYEGYCLTHQNRVVILTQVVYPWVGSAGSVFTDVVTTDVFNYTDPPNSVDMGAQGEVFVQEHPFGASAWGSISAGELFLVKNAGGGYVVSGDLNFPTVTYLGGVTPTYGLLQQAAQTPIGLVYGSNDNGVWLWNGSSQSTKISENLNDDFFNIYTENPIQLSIASWGSWICFTNGWVTDTNTGGWWRLTNPGFTPLYYGIGCYGNSMWAIGASFTSNTSPVAAKYSFATPETTYSWTSYPIPASRDQNIACQRLAVRAQGEGTVTVNLVGINDSVSTASQSPFVFDSNTQPAIVNSSVGGAGGSFLAQDVTVNITSTGSAGGPAPIVYSVSVGYVPSSPASPG